MLSKKVISSSLFALLACSIIGYYLFEPDNEKLRDQMFTYKVHKDKKYDLVVAGDSRIYRGVSTDIIGHELNKTSINLGFSSGAYSEPMYNLIDKKLNQNQGNIIVLGISPLSLTDYAIDNGHIRRLNDLKKEEVIEHLYLNKLINIFAPTTPRFLWNAIFDREANNENYIEEVHISEGWVKSDYRIPNQSEALVSYKTTFSNTYISQKAIADLYTQISKWVKQGFLVYGFVPPSSTNMEELERQHSDFDDFEIAKGFINAGGKWIASKETYTSFDGSHLDDSSAVMLSHEIANIIKSKTYLSEISEETNIRIEYYPFKSKLRFENDFENNTNNIYITDIAHSGKKTGLCASNLKYLGLYQTNTNEIFENKITKVLVTVYINYENENSSALLAIEMRRKEKPILWKGLEVTNITKPNNWGCVKLEVSIPNNITSEDQLKVYIGNINMTDILVDDFTIEMY